MRGQSLRRKGWPLRGRRQRLHHRVQRRRDELHEHDHLSAGRRLPRRLRDRRHLRPEGRLHAGLVVRRRLQRQAHVLGGHLCRHDVQGGLLGHGLCQTGTIDCKATDCTIACTGTGTKVCKDAVTCTSATCNVDVRGRACPGGVTGRRPATRQSSAATTPAPPAARTCYSLADCRVACKSGSCATKMCCDAGTCLVEGGTNNCP